MTLMLPERILERVAAGERLISDGAIGTELIRRGVPMSDLPRVALDQPDVLRSVHRDYVAAGADLLTAHTFSWKPTVEATSEALRIATEVADRSEREIGVWFSMTEQSDLVLLDGIANRIEGAELLRVIPLIETCSTTDAPMLVATLYKIVVNEAGLALSAHVRNDGTLLDGHTIEEWANGVTTKQVKIIGVNCGESPESFPAIVRRMREVTTLPILVQPSLGLPIIDEASRASYAMSPDEFASALSPLYDLENVIVGGCCGTTPEHIAVLRARQST